MALKESVRDFCGLSSDFDSEILELIGQCKADLQRLGVLSTNIEDTDGMIITACKLYAAYMRDVNGKGDVYAKDYNLLRDALALDTKYNTPADEPEESESEDV